MLLAQNTDVPAPYMPATTQNAVIHMPDGARY